MRSEQVERASQEAQIGIHELVVVTDLIFEQVQLVDQEHLDVVFPSVYVLHLIKKVVDLLNQWLPAKLFLFSQQDHLVREVLHFGLDFTPILI